MNTISPTLEAHRGGALRGRQHWHALLTAHSRGLPNDDALACMLASRLTGAGVMPAGLGLHLGDFLDLVDRHFPGVWIPAAELPVPGGFDREEERQELYRLLLTYRANEDHSERWIARMVAAGCMGADHLWQDMGLWSRRDLSALLQGSFPELAARNDRDMKWKKFLYRQLCQEEGIYTCRSPSCEVCVDYASCFAPEV